MRKPRPTCIPVISFAGSCFYLSVMWLESHQQYPGEKNGFLLPRHVFERWDDFIKQLTCINCGWTHVQIWILNQTVTTAFQQDNSSTDPCLNMGCDPEPAFDECNISSHRAHVSHLPILLHPPQKKLPKAVPWPTTGSIWGRHLGLQQGVRNSRSVCGNLGTQVNTSLSPSQGL